MNSAASYKECCPRFQRETGHCALSHRGRLDREMVCPKLYQNKEFYLLGLQAVKGLEVLVNVHRCKPISHSAL